MGRTRLVRDIELFLSSLQFNSNPVGKWLKALMKTLEWPGLSKYTGVSPVLNVHMAKFTIPNATFVNRETKD